MSKDKAKDKDRKTSKEGGRMSWLDADSGEPMIRQYTDRLNSFLEAMADGKVDKKELTDQEKRLVKALERVEPKLDPGLHEEVTELLCELTAYNIMNTVYSIAEAKSAAKFRG